MNMRFKLEDFGRLVRPKKLTHLYLWNKSQSNIEVWWRNKFSTFQWNSKAKKTQLTDHYKCDLPNLFKDLKFGSITNNPESYIGKISGFVVLYKGLPYYIDSFEKCRNFKNKIKKTYGEDCYLPVVAVAVEFYGSVLSVDGEYKESSPWPHTMDKDVVWLYKPSEILTLENIVQYESYELGDMFKMKKKQGMIIKKIKNSTKKFYQKNSAVESTLFILLDGLAYVKIDPDRKM